jgi:hypothetical protein
VARQRRRGSLTLELLFVMPVLLIVLLGTIQFSLMLAVEQQLETASRAGARAAALGADATTVEVVVRQVLGPGKLQSAQVLSVLTDDNGQPLPAGQPVTVLVALKSGSAVPDLLPFAGLSLARQLLVGRTVMIKE